MKYSLYQENWCIPFFKTHSHVCHVRCPKMQFSANGRTWVPCLWTCHTPWSSKLFETHLSRAKIVCLSLPTWVTCVVPAGLFAAWPPRLKLLKKTIKKRSKCLHPRTLEFQAMIHRFIQIQLSITFLYPFGPHLAILQCPTRPRGRKVISWDLVSEVFTIFRKASPKSGRKKGRATKKKLCFGWHLKTPNQCKLTIVN